MINNREILRGEDHPLWNKAWTKEHREHAMAGIKKAQKNGKYNWKRNKQSEETKKKRINTLKTNQLIRIH